jgi:hypothetical protein
MGPTGEQFIADLNELRIIGAMDLPMLGYTYAKVNNAIAGTAGVDSAAFQTSAGGTPSRIADIWRDLRDELQTILGRTAENMHSAGQTVLHIAEAYAATDHSAVAALQHAWQDGRPPGTTEGEHIPAEQPPAVQIPTA